MSSLSYSSLSSVSFVPTNTEEPEANWVNATISVNVEVFELEPEPEPRLIIPMNQMKVEEPDPDVIPIEHVHRKYARFSDEQNAILWEQFNKSPSYRGLNWPSLLERTGMTQKQIKHWFQNRRSDKKTLQFKKERLTAPDVNHLPTLPSTPVSSFFANPFYSRPSMNPTPDALSFYTARPMASATGFHSASSSELVIQQATVFPHSLSQAASELHPHFHTSGMAGIVQPEAQDFVNGHIHQEEITDDEIIDVEK